MARHALPKDTELHSRYRIDTALGAGGFGITYLGHDSHLNRSVAIKEYFPTEFAVREGSYTVRSLDTGNKQFFALGRTWFLREARTLAKYRHPNIVGVMDHFEENDTAYMVLIFEEGQRLSAWLKTLRRAPNQFEIDGIMLPLLAALETMHKNNDLHRDVAMDNIIVRPEGDPVLIDFGSARQAIGQHSRSIDAVVKFGYSPPEQYSVDPKLQGAWSDIYALAATLHLAVTGRLPPDAPGRQLDDNYEPLAKSGIEGYRIGFLEGIDWGLALRPADRPKSISDWRRRLMNSGHEALEVDPGLVEAQADAAPSRPRLATAPDKGPPSGPHSPAADAGTRFSPLSAVSAGAIAGAAKPDTWASGLRGLPASLSFIAARLPQPLSDIACLVLALGCGLLFLINGGIHWQFGSAAFGGGALALAAFTGLHFAQGVPAAAAPRAALALGLLWLLPVPFWSLVVALPLFALAAAIWLAPKPWHRTALRIVAGLNVVIGLLFLLAGIKESTWFVAVASASLVGLGLLALLASRSPPSNA